MPIGRYGPVREVFELCALPASGGAPVELAVGYSTGSARRLARMSRDGTVRWTRALSSSRGMPPSVAASADVIGAVWSDDRELRFASFALDGTPRIPPRRIGAAAHRACIAASETGAGWAVVAADTRGSRFLRIEATGAVVATRPAPRAMECALSTASDGRWLLATSRPSERSETNFLYTQLLAADGAPAGPERNVEQRFARAPVLLRTPTGFHLAWADPLTVDDGEAFRDVALDATGAPMGTPVPHGWNRETGGWGLVPGETAPVQIHATRLDYVEMPSCADRPRHPPPRLPRIHERMGD